MVFHRQIGLKNSKVTNNGHRADQSTSDAQLPSVKMGTPSASLQRKRLQRKRLQRNFVFSELKRSLLDHIHSAIRSTPSSILRRCNPSDEGWPHVLSCESLE